jgi:hypothetical protein
MRAYLPKPVGRTRIEYLEIFTQKTVPVGPPRIRERPGANASKKIRAACARCNTTWMSVMENDTKPLLLPLLLAETMSLDSDAAQKLAEWVTLKIIIAEHNEPDNAVFSQSDWTAFMNDRTIPSFVGIWIAQIDQARWSSTLARQTATVCVPPNLPPNPHRKNVQSTAFGVGRLLVSAIVSKAADFKPEINATFANGIRRIWPLPNQTINWPPTRTLTGRQADALGRALDAINGWPNVRWKPVPANGSTLV